MKDAADGGEREAGRNVGAERLCGGLGAGAGAGDRQQGRDRDRDRARDRARPGGVRDAPVFQQPTMSCQGIKYLFSTNVKVLVTDEGTT